jgi:hypothetical protein
MDRTSTHYMTLRLLVTGILVAGVVGCSSPKQTPTAPSEAADPNEALPESLPFTKDEFIGVVSAFIANAGSDIKAHGYSVVFVDIGPESLEEQMPETFQEMVQKASIEGVQVRGYSRMLQDGNTFKDKVTGERGVRFDPGHFSKVAPDTFYFTGEWDESPDKGHFEKHKIIREGTKWKVL